MKQLLRNIILYLSPLWLLLLLLICLPVDKRMRYQHIKNDCYEHGIWVHDRIWVNDTSIDIAFLGSSRTLNAVREGVVEEQLNLAAKHMHLANLAYCRYGVNLYYVFAKELLRRYKPQMLIVEVREDESMGSHPIFPYLADEADVFLPYPAYTSDIFPDMSTAFFYKLQLHQDALFNKSTPMPLSYYPWGGSGFKDTISIEKLNEEKKQRALFKDELSPAKRKFKMAYPRHYLKKIHELCVQNGVRLRFLYLPSYGTHVQPFESKTYLQYGDIITPPMHIFENPGHWFDEDHLNNTGAWELSVWLGRELAK